MAIAYSRDDFGAPALTYNPSPNVIEHFTAIKTVLVSCLVSGYGAKLPAGWSLVDEGEHYIVLRPGSGSGYLTLSWLDGAITVYLGETYFGMSSGVPLGDGVKTGTAAGNSSPHKLSGYYQVGAEGSSTWMMVADSKTFALCMPFYFSDSPVELVPYAGQPDVIFTFYAGEDSQGNFVSVGGQSTAGTDPSSIYGYFEGGTGFTAHKFPSTGLLIGPEPFNASMPLFGLYDNSIKSFQVARIDSVGLSPISWFGDGVMAGNLRGLVLPGQLALLHTSPGAYMLGFDETATTRNASNKLDLGDGSDYFVAVKHSGYPFFLMTTNPDFW